MRKCIKLEWANPTHFAACAVGEPADYTGLKINAVYDDGSRDTVDVTSKMFNESNLQTREKERKSMIYYDGQKLPVTIPVLDCYLDRIEVHTAEDFVCYAGVPFPAEEVMVIAYYSNGTQKEIRNYRYYPRDVLELGISEISFRYGRCKAVLEISVLPAQQTSRQTGMKKEGLKTEIVRDMQLLESPSKTIVGVSVAKPPKKRKYLVGDMDADLDGGRLDLVYSDGSVGQIDMVTDGKAEVSSEKVGKGLVTFECFGKKLYFDVEILEPKVVRLKVEKLPYKTEYIEGESLDLTGLVLEATYNDMSVRMIKGLQNKEMVMNMAQNEDGITLAFEGRPFTIPVKVEKLTKPVTALSMQLSKYPNKLVYVEREATKPDLTGAEILMQLSDGRREIVPLTEAVINAFDCSKPGVGELKGSYKGKEFSFNFKVVPRSLISIEFESGLSKTTYLENEDYNLKGVVLYACYDNGEKEVITDYEIDKEKASVGDTSLKFSYQGRSVSVPVSVIPLEIVVLSWMQKPKKLCYYTKETDFSCDGGVLLVEKNDGSKTEVPLTKTMIKGFSTETAGCKTIRVGYGNKELELEIQIEERKLVGLQIKKWPRTVYVENELFDKEGLEVEGLYSGGSKENVEVDFMPKGPLTKEVSQVILFYQDKAVMLPIKVETREEKLPARLPDRDRSFILDLKKTEVKIDDAAPLLLAKKQDVFEPPEREENNEQHNPNEVGEESTEESDVSQVEISENTAKKEVARESDITVAEDTKRLFENSSRVPDFYPSTFSIRFQENPDEIL